MAIVCVLTICAASALAALPDKPYERAVTCQALADGVQASDQRTLTASRAIAFELESYVKSGKKRRKKILSDISDAAVKLDELDAASREARWTQCLDVYAPEVARAT